MPQIHVHLHDDLVNYSGPIHVKVGGVGGGNKVEVGEDAPCQSHNCHILPYDLT